ncbi:hypothetical protein RvY_17385 [Ramazzottius varieornatus]|uniref:BED-type domain-containing protein n=1 Tax=Ramazzottius varieornatus TaxID=947166 RepID=A0A1D1W1X1_RAMVA|nr:hypothetical protein RvY_17385 [Ramazzottius varieornatus]
MPSTDDAVSEDVEVMEVLVPAKSTRKRRQSSSNGGSKRHYADTVALNRAEIRSRIADGTCELRPHAKSRSEIWNFFSDVFNNETQEVLEYCACNRCHKVYKHGPNGGTSCLAEHVQSCVSTTEEHGVLAEFLETPSQMKTQALLEQRQEKIAKRKAKIESEESTAEIRSRIEAGTCELQSNPEGRSDIWKGFSKVINAATKQPTRFIACNTCHKTYRHGRSGGTSNLIEHLKNCMVGFATAELPTKPEIKNITIQKPAVVKTSKKKAAEKAKQSVAGDQSFRAEEISSRFSSVFAKFTAAGSKLEGEPFRSFIDNVLGLAKAHKGFLRAEDVIPTAEIISQQVAIEAQHLRAQLSQKIKYAIATKGCCISLGTWVESRTKTKLIAARFHHVDEETVSGDLLFVAEFDPIVYRDGIAIRDLVAEKLAEFSFTEIDTKSVIIVTDATEKMKAAFEDFDRVTCAAHGIDTCLRKFVNCSKEALRMPDEALPVWKLFQDCRVLVNHCKKVYIARQLTSPLISPNDAKWISNLDMLNSIINAYAELESVLEERGEGDKIPRPLGFLRAVADFYQPFGAAVEALSASQAPTVHLVVPHFFRLKAHVHKPLSAEHGSFPEMNALLELQKHVQAVLDKKLLIDDLHRAAVFLNPAMKKLLMFEPEEREEVHRAVMAQCESFTVSTSKSDEHTQPRPDDSMCEFSEFSSYADTSEAISAAEEITLYMSLPPPPSSKTVLQFWREHAENLPKLSTFALRMLCVQASGMPPERLVEDVASVFAKDDYVNGVEKLDDLMFLKWAMIN